MDHRLQDIGTLTLKVKQGTCPIYIGNLFKQYDGDYSLRNADFVISDVRQAFHQVFWAFLCRRLPKSVKAECNLNNLRIIQEI